MFTQYKQQNQVELGHHQWETPLAVRPVFLKLAALELGGRLAPGSREGCDLDVLVPEEQVAEAAHALRTSILRRRR